LTFAAMFSWRYLGPEGALGDGLLPPEGKTMGWIGKTVPLDAYGTAGDALLRLKPAYLWLMGIAWLVWLVPFVRNEWKMGIRGASRRLGLPGGLAALGFGMVCQISFFLLASFFVPSGPVWLPLPMAASLLRSLGEGVWASISFGLPLMGLVLIGLAIALGKSEGQRRAWLTFIAAIVALAAASILSAGVVAGTVLALRNLDQLTLPEYRQAAQVQLALGLPLNIAFSTIGWAVVVAGVRALRAPGPSMISRLALLRGSSLAGLILVAGAFAFWHLTALPVAETSPSNGATQVPTNAPIIVRLEPGERTWTPGIKATYAEDGAYVRGSTHGSIGQVAFTPQGGWRPNAVVEVDVCCGPNTRGYRFSFTTADGPSPDTTPLPAPAKPRGPQP
jgi:hypothetical protein